MNLKRVEIQGFKSFADKTILELNAGITAIVGPNGSGKSNLLDAIRWVIGEQSAKSLRGSKMEDVIFAGTETRKPLGYAEVIMVLDNSDRKIDMEFSEIAVSRRLYRSGESDFFINKTRCRLKDIQQMFMDTGLSKEGYSIISQGQIGNIVKLEDRRHIFEEAAGISKYKYRKEEAEKKLLNVEDNLLRVCDIINELKERLEPLKIQSEKARQYLDLREKLKIYEVNLSLENILKYKNDIKEIERNYRIIEDNLNSENIKIKRFEEELNTCFENLKEQDKIILEYNEGLYGLENQNLQYLNQNELLNNVINYDKKSIDKLEKEIDGLERKAANIENAYKILLHESGKYDSLINTSKEELKLAEEKNKEFEALTKKEALELQTLKQTEMNLLKVMSEKNIELNNNNNLYNNFLDKIKESEQKLHNDEEKDLRCLLEQARDKRELLKVEEENRRLSILEEEKKKILLDIKHITDTYNENTLLKKNLETKKLMYENMEKALEGYNKSVKSVLKAFSDTHGIVANIIKVPERFITAVEIALGGALQNIVVEDEEVAKKIINYLKANKLGRATFLPLSTIKGKAGLRTHIKGEIGIAAELIEFDDRYKNIINNLIGRVIIAEDMDSALAISKHTDCRIVTIEGELIAKSGAITGGSVFSSNILSRGVEIEKLQKQIEDIDLDEPRKMLDLLNIKLIEKENGIADIQSKIRDRETACIRIDADIKNLNISLERINKEKEECKNNIKNFEERIGILKGNIDNIKDSIAELENQDRITKKQIEIKSYDDRSHEREEIIKVLTEKRLRLAGLIKDSELHEERIKSHFSEIENLKMQISEKESEIKALKFKNHENSNEIEINLSKLEEIKLKTEELKSLVKENSEIKNGLNERINSLQKITKESREAAVILQDSFNKIEVRKEKIELGYENILNRLWENYGLTHSTAEELRNDSLNLKEVSRLVPSLKNQIQDLGHINVEAIEEYKATKERYEFLSKQKNDLENSKADLSGIIQEMSEIMALEFSNKFKLINKYFDEIFKELFGGGRAAAKLLNREDILNSGIEIEVQLPGKTVQNISLLSGGEIAMVGSVLIFAILKINPPAFSILDEIDAPFDDQNVYKFIEYLKNYETQFLVITHRRGTMEAADVLYGVTMAEKGVSKLLTINIDDV